MGNALWPVRDARMTEGYAQASRRDPGRVGMGWVAQPGAETWQLPNGAAPASNGVCECPGAGLMGWNEVMEYIL